MKKGKSQKTYTELFGDRYPKNWDSISVYIRAQCPVCCIPGCQKLAVLVHHTHYIDVNNRPLNRITLLDVPSVLGVYLFPLCENHHGKNYKTQAHHIENWQPSRSGIWEAYQKTAYYEKLVSGFNEKYRG
jgi:hypothetical protein